MSQQVGFAAERQAQDFLMAQGFRFITKNYRSRWGEIDLIMSNNKVLVFIEVRARMTATHGNALESITRPKQRKILKTALHYMVTHKQYNDYSSRFDVVALQGVASPLWIKDAFNADILS